MTAGRVVWKYLKGSDRRDAEDRKQSRRAVL